MPEHPVARHRAASAAPGARVSTRHLVVAGLVVVAALLLLLLL
jgi:hypothetical protein